MKKTTITYRAIILSKKTFLLTVILFLSSVLNNSFAQVGIGTTTPNSSAQLEIKANNKGLLIPQVSLQSTTDAVTISNGNVTGLTVFNTSTISDISPGYYYWFDNRWRRISIDSDLIISTLVDNNNGTYTYTNEEGVTSLINVIGDMFEYADTLMSNPTFITNLGDVLSNSQTFIDSLIANGDFINDVWNTFITDTTLINNLGDVLVSDTSFINNLGDVLVSDTTFINNLGDVLVSDTTFINNLGDVLISDTTFTNNLGDVLIADSVFIENLISTITTNQQFLDSLAQFVTDFETITTLVDNGDGTITYTNEDGVISTVSTLKTASNGLNAIAGDVKLGGNLTQTTLINQGSHDLIFKSNTGSGITFNSGNNPLNNRLFMPTDGLEIQSNDFDATKPVLSLYSFGAERFRVTGGGNVGIGTNTPQQSLSIAGANALGVDNATTFSARNSAGIYETFLHPRWSDDVMYLNFGANGFNIRNNSSTSVMFMADNGNVGIGNTNPVANLDINGTIKISGNNPGAGKVLTSDATGLASWQGVSVIEETLPSGSGSNFGVDETGETIIPNSTTTFVIPDGGRAVTINYSLGIEFTSGPFLSDGNSQFTVYMYIDGVKSGIRQVFTQPNTNQCGANYHFSSVKQLTPGAHTIRFNIFRTRGNFLLPAGSNHDCRITDYYRNVSFSN